jgi:hypothetical protein
MDIERDLAEDIGQEALDKIGYAAIMDLARTRGTVDPEDIAS